MLHQLMEGGPAALALVVLALLMAPLLLLRLLVSGKTAMPGLGAACCGALLAVGLLGAHLGVEASFDAMSSVTAD